MRKRRRSANFRPSNLPLTDIGITKPLTMKNRTTPKTPGDNAPAISLAPGGEGFWESRDLPGELKCPEVPRRSAEILDRVGPFPNWRGERPLRDLLIPVYEAASQYGVEHVFGQKSTPAPPAPLPTGGPTRRADTRTLRRRFLPDEWAEEVHVRHFRIVAIAI